MIKSSYSESVNKKVVQNLIYNGIQNKFNHLIGLGGPDLPDYLKLAKKAGIRDAIIYEYNANQLLIQASKPNKTLPTKVIYGDIIRAQPQQINTFYDLDFCCSVKSAIEHIKKFKDDSCVFTFSIRPLTFIDTISQYVEAISGRKRHKVFLTHQSAYYKQYEIHLKDDVISVFTYKDSVPMIVFLNNL